MSLLIKWFRSSIGEKSDRETTPDPSPQSAGATDGPLREPLKSTAEADDGPRVSAGVAASLSLALGGDESLGVSSYAAEPCALISAGGAEGPDLSGIGP